jgi:uncharacterized protein
MTVTLPTASYWLTYLHPELVRLAQPVQGWFYTISPQGDLTISLTGLIILGLFIGLLTGSFGVGSGFLTAPFLNLLGNVPYNVAVGSDLTHMVGSATLANLRQRALGYVDYKLALLLFGGSVVGVECGAQLLEVLKYAGEIPLGGHRLGVLQLTMTVIYVLLLGWIGSALYRETRASRRAASAPPPPETPAILEASRLHSINLPPMVSLPVSGVEAISLWLILGVGLVSGLLTGLLGVSGAFIRMPALIYVLGVPTVVSLGTNLFELLILAIYGAFSHSIKGNVDLMLVIILLITTTVGNQVGILLQRTIVGPRSLQLYILILFATIFLMIVKIIM